MQYLPLLSGGLGGLRQQRCCQRQGMGRFTAHGREGGDRFRGLAQAQLQLGQFNAGAGCLRRSLQCLLQALGGTVPILFCYLGLRLLTQVVRLPGTEVTLLGLLHFVCDGGCQGPVA